MQISLTRRFTLFSCWARNREESFPFPVPSPPAKQANEQRQRKVSINIIVRRVATRRTAIVNHRGRGSGVKDHSLQSTNDEVASSTRKTTGNSMKFLPVHEWISHRLSASRRPIKPIFSLWPYTKSWWKPLLWIYKRSWREIFFTLVPNLLHRNTTRHPLQCDLLHFAASILKMEWIRKIARIPDWGVEMRMRTCLKSVKVCIRFDQK